MSTPERRAKPRVIYGTYKNNSGIFFFPRFFFPSPGKSERTFIPHADEYCARRFPPSSPQRAAPPDRPGVAFDLLIVRALLFVSVTFISCQCPVPGDSPGNADVLFTSGGIKKKRKEKKKAIANNSTTLYYYTRVRAEKFQKPLLPRAVPLSRRYFSAYLFLLPLVFQLHGYQSPHFTVRCAR